MLSAAAIFVYYRGSSLGNSSLDLCYFLAGSAIGWFPGEDYDGLDRQSSFSQCSNIGFHPHVIGIIPVHGFGWHKSVFGLTRCSEFAFQVLIFL